MHWASLLRQELSARNREIASVTGSVHALTPGEVPCVIFGRNLSGAHANFHPVSYRNIRSNPRWLRRLSKVHTSGPKISDWRWMELDCANSSDALLMNIFCRTRSVRGKELCSLLGVSPGLVPEFGFRPRIPFCDAKTDRTEMDMKLGPLLIEAKLTESDFQSAPIRLIERYRDINHVFEIQALPAFGGRILNYQLIRGVLAAHCTGGSFCVLCDARRPDLIERWFSVLQTVRCCDLRCRLQLLTWQELAVPLPKSFRQFLTNKYGVTAVDCREFAPWP